MPMLESMPAVRRIDTNRADLHAFDVVGVVSSADLENLFGLMEAAYALHPHIDLLLRVTDCDGVDLGDVDSETMKEGKANASEHVGRCAVVGDRVGLAAADSLFVISRAVEVKEFGPDEEDAAWTWVGGGPA